MDDIYREEILDHYRHPRNFGKIDNPDIYKEDNNPLCGDTEEIMIKLDGDKIKEIKFLGKGCAISIASASILTEHLKGKSLSEIQKMTREDLLNLIKLDLTPTRVKCAMLPLITVKKGIIEYESNKNIQENITKAITDIKIRNISDNKNLTKKINNNISTIKKRITSNKIIKTKIKNRLTKITKKTTTKTRKVKKNARRK